MGYRNARIALILCHRGLCQAFNAFEAISVAFFTLEFLSRLYSARCNQVTGYSHWGYICSFYGIVDIISIVPFYFETAFSIEGSAVFRAVRLCRLFQLEHFMEAFTLMDDVFLACADILAATGILALIIWLTGRSLSHTHLPSPLSFLP